MNIKSSCEKISSLSVCLLNLLCKQAQSCSWKASLVPSQQNAKDFFQRRSINKKTKILLAQ